MLQEKLLQIGFSEKESTMYLELLRLGAQAVSVIAKRTGLNRTTAYSILSSLVKKGVVSSYVNCNVKYFVACDPNSLVGYIDRQCRTFSYRREQILSAIPQFRSLLAQYDFKRPVVTFFDGLEGVKQVMYDALNAEGVFRACLSLHKWFDSGLMDFLIEYKNFRINNKKVPLKAIVSDTPEVRIFFDKNYNIGDGLTDVLFVDLAQYSAFFESEINIYDNKISIVNLDKGCEYGVMIQSEKISNMQKTIFDMAWKGFGG